MAFYDSDLKSIIVNVPALEAKPRRHLGCNSFSPLSTECLKPECKYHEIKSHGTGGMTKSMETIIYCRTMDYISPSSVVSAFSSVVESIYFEPKIDSVCGLDPEELFHFIQYSLLALVHIGKKIDSRPVPTNIRQLRAQKQQFENDKKKVQKAWKQLMTSAENVNTVDLYFKYRNEDSLIKYYLRTSNIGELYCFMSEIRGSYSSKLLKKVWGLSVLPCIPMFSSHCGHLFSAAHAKSVIQDYMMRRLISENNLCSIDENPRLFDSFILTRALRKQLKIQNPLCAGIIFEYSERLEHKSDVVSL
jgi:hypothetical protein